MVLETDKQNLKQIKEFKDYVLQNNKDIYNELSSKSKIVKILGKTNYNYIVYVIISKLKRNKMKNKYK